MKHKPFLAKLLIAPSVLCLILAGILLTWRLIPGPRQLHTQVLPAGSFAIADSGQTYVSEFPIDLKLSYPSKIKASEKNEIMLQLSVHSDEASVDYAQPVVAELSAPRLLLEPHGTIQAVLDNAHKITMEWQVTSSLTGIYPANLWVSLIFENPSDQSETAPVLALDLEIEVVRLWGMDAKTVTWLGLFALLLWGIFMAFSAWLEHRWLQR